MIEYINFRKLVVEGIMGISINLLERTGWRWRVVMMLWRVPYIKRHYCWADAVLWALGWPGHEGPLETRANHTCYYCLTYNTQAEIDDHLDELARENQTEA